MPLVPGGPPRISQQKSVLRDAFAARDARQQARAQEKLRQEKRQAEIDAQRMVLEKKEAEEAERQAVKQRQQDEMKAARLPSLADLVESSYGWKEEAVLSGMLVSPSGEGRFIRMIIRDSAERYALVQFNDGVVVTDFMPRADLAAYMEEADYYPASPVA